MSPQVRVSGSGFGTYFSGFRVSVLRALGLNATGMNRSRLGPPHQNVFKRVSPTMERIQDIADSKVNATLERE